jgi:hypothetical protein
MDVLILYEPAPMLPGPATQRTPGHEPGSGPHNPAEWKNIINPSKT